MTRYDRRIIDEIKQDNKPVLIYGNAAYAVSVCRFLIAHSISIQSFVVDDYVNIEEPEINGIPVRRISQFYPEIEKYTLALGFCNIEKCRVMLNIGGLLRCKVYRLWAPEENFGWDDEFWEAHRADFQRASDMLQDKKSKAVLSALIKARQEGKTQELLSLAEGNQYFNELTYTPEPEGEVFVDCGAFNGDTVRAYAEFTRNGYKKIYALEPNAANFQKLETLAASLRDVHCIKKGAWDSDGFLKFTESGSGSWVSDEGPSEISVTSIDNLVEGERVTFIKMDIEGSEYQALLGARGTLARWMPKLALCVYHKRDDIYKFVDFLSGIHTNSRAYQFFLRHHSNGASETVLYAIPNRV